MVNNVRRAGLRMCAQVCTGGGRPGLSKSACFFVFQIEPQVRRSAQFRTFLFLRTYGKFSFRTLHAVHFLVFPRLSGTFTTLPESFATLPEYSAALPE